MVCSITRSAIAYPSLRLFPYRAVLSGRHRIQTILPRARLVSSFRSRDIATRMDLREVLSRRDPWSRPDASCSARIAKCRPIGARGTEAGKLGQETKTTTKDHENEISAHPQRVRQLNREGVSRVLTEEASEFVTEWLSSQEGRRSTVGLGAQCLLLALSGPVWMARRMAAGSGEAWELIALPNKVAATPGRPL